mmetsp:Transcript_26523/g.48110  ORF Transcript_26523/g.48110 Transcript_26523/m.48110 type:complete len:262 (+) Transcript_26523:129-914(+)
MRFLSRSRAEALGFVLAGAVVAGGRDEATALLDAVELRVLPVVVRLFWCSNDEETGISDDTTCVTAGTKERLRLDELPPGTHSSSSLSCTPPRNGFRSESFFRLAIREDCIVVFGFGRTTILKARSSKSSFSSTDLAFSSSRSAAFSKVLKLPSLSLSFGFGKLYVSAVDGADTRDASDWIGDKFPVCFRESLIFGTPLPFGVAFCANRRRPSLSISSHTFFNICSTLLHPPMNAASCAADVMDFESPPFLIPSFGCDFHH